MAIGGQGMAKAEDFHVSVLDLFGVLLPGAIATAVLQPHFGSVVFGPLLPAPASDAGRWAAFLACAYFLGHLVFLIGSYVDDLYDRRYKAQPNTRKRGANNGALSAAKEIRKRLREPEGSSAINNFQWARAILISAAPAAAADVHRLEADSKFFRSLLVISVLAAVVFAFDRQWVAASVALVLIAPCFLRYSERRLKSTTQAYLHIVALDQLGRLEAQDSAKNIE